MCFGGNVLAWNHSPGCTHSFTTDPEKVTSLTGTSVSWSVQWDGLSLAPKVFANSVWMMVWGSFQQKNLLPRILGPVLKHSCMPAWPGVLVVLLVTNKLLPGPVEDCGFLQDLESNTKLCINECSMISKTHHKVRKIKVLNNLCSMISSCENKGEGCSCVRVFYVPRPGEPTTAHGPNPACCLSCYSHSAKSGA